MFQSQNLDFAHYARAFALSGMHQPAAMHALANLERAGATSRVANQVKAAVGAFSTSDAAWAGMLGADGLTAKFINSLASQSIFSRCLALGMAELPLETMIEVVTAGLTGSAVGEAKTRPVSHMTLASGGILRRRVSALIVTTNSLLEAISPGAVKLIDSELRRGVSRGLDAEMLAIIVDGGTPALESAGNDDASIRDDVKRILDAINVAGAGGLLFAMAPDVANRATLIDDGKGEMTPAGGRFFGVDTIVSTAVVDGTMVAIDATGIAGSVEKIEFEHARAADIQMLDEPLDEPTTLISLWQANCTALAASAYFGVRKLRNASVAVMSNIAWADAAIPSS